MADYEYSDLTKNQQRLIDGLLADMTHVEAYRQAYPNSKMTNDQMSVAVANMIKNQGNRYTKFALVYKKMKEEVDKKAKEASIATAIEVLQFYTAVMRNEMGEEIPMLVSNGELGTKVKMVQKSASLSDRQKAADALAKHHGILTSKIQVDALPVIIKGEMPDDY